MSNEIHSAEGKVRAVQEVVSRSPLTRTAICRAALQIIDSDGLGAVSMRGLASVLGVKAGSLYHHFSSKDELLAEVAESLYRETGPPPLEGEWKDRVCSIFLQLAELVESHPQAAPLLVGNLARSRSARDRARALVEAATASDLDPQTTASLLGNLAALLAGYGLLSGRAESSTGPRGFEDSSTSPGLLGVGTQVQLTGLQFEDGVRALIDGFTPERPFAGS